MEGIVRASARKAEGTKKLLDREVVPFTRRIADILGSAFRLKKK